MSFSEGLVSIASDQPTTSLQKTVSLLNYDSEIVTSAGNLSLTTSSSGSTFTSFSDRVAKQLSITNVSGYQVDVKRNSDTVYQPIPSPGVWTFRGISNANQISVRRTDVSNAQISVIGEWES